MEGINYGNLKQSIQGMRREVQLCWAQLGEDTEETF